MFDVASDELLMSRNPRKSSLSISKSYSATEQREKELRDYDVEFDVRPPSGTNHSQPGKHLSIDTRFSEISLDETSWVAESEKDISNVHLAHTKQRILGNRIRQDKVKIPKANCYITSPFKQGPEKHREGPVMVVDPGHDLKQRTLAGVERIKKQMDKARRLNRQTSRSYSHLLRGGNLRPLGRPVSASGPVIRNCRGIMPGARSHFSFTSREGGYPLDGDSNSCRQFYRSVCSAGGRSKGTRPKSPNELLRPESSIHNTSYASSVNEVSDYDPQEGFSEDECQDSVDVSATNIKREENNKSLPFGAGHFGVKSRLRKEPKKTRCKEDCDDIKGHSEDDSDNPDGDWARRGSAGGCYRHGKQKTRAGERSLTVSSVHGRRRNEGQSCTDGFIEVKKNCVDSLDGSSGWESNLRSLTKVTEFSDKSFLHHGSFHQRKSVFEIPATTPGCDEETTLPKAIKAVKITKRTEVSAFPVEDLSLGDEVNGEVLYDSEDEPDTDRMSSADIFNALDCLNLSMSDMKLLTPLDKRRVKSAGSTRDTSSGTLYSGLKHKGRKVSIGCKNPKNQNKTKNTNYDKSSLGDDLTHYTVMSESLKGLGESLPGYFTQQYKKLQEEKSRPSGDTVLSPSRILALISTDDRQNKNTVDENSNAINIRDVESDYGIKGTSTLNQFDSEISEQAEFSDKQGTEFGRMNQQLNSRRCFDGVFVPVEQKSSVKGAEYGDDSSSSGVDSRSYVTECSHITDDLTQNESQGFYSEDDTAACSAIEAQESDDEGHLEIIAQSKLLSEPRNSKQKKPLAPYPPVSFIINAKPPPGHLYYFAYGPDMNSNRMAIYLRREPKTRLWGVLFGFRLRFNKKGKSIEAGGFPNVEFSSQDSVEGCVYCLTDTDLTMLDNCMGYPKHYCRVVLPVWMLNCTSPSEHGVAQFCVPAVLYVAQEDWVAHDSQSKLDCSYSVNQCMKAQDILTPNYVQFLASQVNA